MCSNAHHKIIVSKETKRGTEDGGKEIGFSILLPATNSGRIGDVLLAMKRAVGHAKCSCTEMWGV